MDDCMPPGCYWNIIGHGLCHQECNTKLLRYSDGDCNKVCEPDWIGDNYCDNNCWNAENQWDGGDCDAQIAAQPHYCEKEWIGDGTCDPTCNYEETQWDGGDCAKA